LVEKETQISELKTMCVEYMNLNLQIETKIKNAQSIEFNLKSKISVQNNKISELDDALQTYNQK